MTPFQALRPVLLLGPTLLVAACSSWFGAPQTTRDLGDRLQTRLTPDITAGQVALERLPDGARVTIVEQSLFPGGGAQLDDKGRAVITRLIQGLLAPNLLQIEVADSAATPAALQGARAGAVTQYFSDYGLGSVVQTVAPAETVPVGPAGSSLPGMTITVSLNAG